MPRGPLSCTIRLGGVVLASLSTLCGCDQLLGLDELPPRLDELPAIDCTPGTTRSCYSGSAASEGVGECRAGSQLCLAHGRGYGVCEDEVLPQPEQCGNAVDENCDGATTCGEALWSASYGVQSDEVGTRIASDGDGNVIVAGYYRDALNLGNGPLPDAQSRNIYLAKYDPEGVPEWDVALYGPDNLIVRDIAVAPDASITLVARLRGEITPYGAGDVASAGDNDVWIVKFDPNGSHLWTRTFGDADAQEPRAVDVDADGNIVVAGYYRGFLDLDGELVGPGDGQDVFVLKLSSDGEFVWSHVMPGPQDQFALALAVAPDASVYVTGHFLGSFDSGAGIVESNGDRDVFLLKIDGEGQPQWAKGFGDVEAQRCYGIAADSQSNVAIIAYGRGTMDFGGEALTAMGGDDVFVASWSATGEHRFSHRYGDYALAQGHGIAFDPLDHVIVTGGYEGSIDFGGGALAEAGVRTNNIFLAKLSPVGEHLFSQGFVVDGDQDAGAIERGWRDVATDPLGNILLVGYFERGPIDFGNGPLEPVGGSDVFFAKFTP